MRKKTFALFSLGCKVNQAELENLTRNLLNYNFKKASIKEKADICIINTCTVTGVADQKSRQKIRKVVKENPDSFIIVTGCYAEREKENIEKIPGINLVLNNREKKLIPELLKKQFSIINEESSGPLNFIKDGRTRAFIKIQDGCDNFCSYCIIPYVRGKPESISPENIIKDICDLCLSGYKEIVLTGINLGTYGRDLSSNITLTELIKSIIKATSLQRLRISSIEPPDITPELLEIFREYPAFCHHLHIPLQYGHNEILKKMNRTYTVEDFRKTINQIRSGVEDIAITTDIMVGFPGEKEKHFEATRNLVEELEFAKLHVFSYSPRKGTLAFELSETVDDKIKKERSRILLKSGEKLTENFYKKYTGHIFPVLLEHRKDKKTGLLKGLTGNYIQIFTEGEDSCMGEIVTVKLKGFIKELFMGEILMIEQ